MKIWLPFVETGTGTDVFTRTLEGELRKRGHEVQTTVFGHGWQYVPWRFRGTRMPVGTDVVLANSWSAFAFRRSGVPLVSVEHLLVLDPALAPYRSLAQAVFHSTLVRHFESRSASLADVTVAVSRYTAEQLQRCFGIDAAVIHNGVDTRFFEPMSRSGPTLDARPMRLLFVGTLSRRKGADLLEPIMRQLGSGYELRLTGNAASSGDLADLPGVAVLGRLDREQLRSAYREADVLLFPSRLEGLPLVVLEAMACGTPVVAAREGSIEEIVDEGVNGRLCPVDDVQAFADAILDLRGRPDRIRDMGRAARQTVETKFSIELMTDRYVGLLERLLGFGQS